MNAKETPTIIIVKKKVHVEAHHGSSWKVAYADFVTALMAFFLVMWILSLDQKMRVEIESYFKDPFSTTSEQSGISETATGGKSPIADGMRGAMQGPAWKEPAPEESFPALEGVAEALQRQIAGRPDLARLAQHVAMKVTDVGFEIDLIESEQNLFFASGSAELPPAARALLAVIGRQLAGVRSPVTLEGHTDSVAYLGRSGYSNWELSTDRANAVRRALEAAGLPPGQVAGVRGFADNVPHDWRHPTRAANRRVAILVGYTADESDAGPAGNEAAAGAAPAPDAETGGGGGRLFSVDIKPARPLSP